MLDLNENGFFLRYGNISSMKLKIIKKQKNQKNNKLFTFLYYPCDGSSNKEILISDMVLFN